MNSEKKNTAEAREFVHVFVPNKNVQNIREASKKSIKINKSREIEGVGDEGGEGHGGGNATETRSSEMSIELASIRYEVPINTFFFLYNRDKEGRPSINLFYL